MIELTAHDGRTRRMRVDQIDSVTRADGGDAGVIHTSPGQLTRVLNVTHVLKQWQRLLFIVSRQAKGYHGYLQRAFADVDWAEVIFDRRRGERRQQDSPWMGAGVGGARGPTSTPVCVRSAGPSCGSAAATRARTRALPDAEAPPGRAVRG